MKCHMATFTIKYRRKDGGMAEKVVDAKDRADVFAQMKAEGITPVSVSKGGSAAKRGASVSSSGNSAVLRRVALAVVVVVGCGVAWWLSQGGDKPSAPAEKVKTKKTALAEEVKPAKAPAPAEKIEPIKPPRIPFKDRPTNGMNAAELRKWRALNRPPPGYTNDTSRTEAPPKYAIFRHRSENEIAAYLTMKPGEGMVGTPVYGKRFREDFLKSLETPILIDKEKDSLEDQELKKAMIETKADLKARMDAGEDIGEILLQTRKEYQELARYKMTIQDELRKLYKDDSLTMQDMDDFVEAANKMLEDKGIAPIKMGPVTRRMLMRRKGVTE